MAVWHQPVSVLTELLIGTQGHQEASPEKCGETRLQLQGNGRRREACMAKLIPQSPDGGLTNHCCFSYYFSFIYVFICFLEPHLQHMEVPRLGVKSELQLPAYTTATAMQDPSRICDLHHSSRHYWILNPLNEARDQTCNLQVLGRIHFSCATTGTP